MTSPDLSPQAPEEIIAAPSAAVPDPLDGGRAAVSEDLTGRRLGRYRVERVLRAGSMSTLYRAVDVRLDRLVALKVISPLLAADEEFRARFVDEARNIAAIDHPHVVPLWDHDEIDGHLYLAMRYVAGHDLAEIINGRPLPIARTLALGWQAASGLDAVHAHGLVHLDVKPANLLIAPGSGGHEQLFLADFGLTRRGAAPAATAAGGFLGSPAFAAPEHLRGQHVSAATDLYALGCVLHTALTGHPPYRGSVDEVIAGHLTATPPPASATRAVQRPCPEPGLAVGAAVDAVLAAALATDPAARPPSAGTLLAALRDAAHRDARTPAPTAAPPPPPRVPSAPTTAGATSGSTAGSTAGSTSSAGPRSVHARAVSRRTAAPVAPSAGDAFTARRPAARPRNLEARIAVAVGVLAVVLAVLLAVLL